MVLGDLKSMEVASGREYRDARTRWGPMELLKEAQVAIHEMGERKQKRPSKHGLALQGSLFVSQVTADWQARKDLADQLIRLYAEQHEAPGDSVNTWNFVRLAGPRGEIVVIGPFRD